jgi:hypothetical protein
MRVHRPERAPRPPPHVLQNDFSDGNRRRRQQLSGNVCGGVGASTISTAGNGGRQRATLLHPALAQAIEGTLPAQCALLHHAFCLIFLVHELTRVGPRKAVAEAS